MARGQRIVLVIAVGAIAVVVANTINAVLDQPPGGWFMYAPNSEVLFSDGSDTGPTIRAALVWVGAIGSWLGISWLILRERPPRPEP